MHNSQPIPAANRSNASGLVAVVFLAILGFAVYGVVAAIRSAQRPAVPDYSASFSRGSRIIVPLPANPRKVELSLRTSWIPGDDKTGTLRYVVGFSLPQPSDSHADSLFLTRVSWCTFSIDLLDNQGFKIATIPVKPVRLVGEDEDVTALSDSETASMSRTSYESIAATWSPTWNCF